MKQIRKFKLPIIRTSYLPIPDGAKILTVRAQPHDPLHVFLWAEIDPEATKRARKFHVVGTGQEFDPSPYTYIGTVEIAGGVLVWHVYEEKL